MKGWGKLQRVLKVLLPKKKEEKRKSHPQTVSKVGLPLCKAAALERYLEKSEWGPGTKEAVSVFSSPFSVNLGDELRFAKILPRLLKLDHKSKQFLEKSRRGCIFFPPPWRKKKSPPPFLPSRGVGERGGVGSHSPFSPEERLGDKKGRPGKNGR